MSVTTLLPPADSGIEQALEVSIWYQLGFILIHSITLLHTDEIWDTDHVWEPAASTLVRQSSHHTYEKIS